MFYLSRSDFLSLSLSLSLSFSLSLSLSHRCPFQGGEGGQREPVGSVHWEEGETSVMINTLILS